jgi:hypothetical protein
MPESTPNVASLFESRSANENPIGLNRRTGGKRQAISADFEKIQFYGKKKGPCADGSSRETQAAVVRRSEASIQESETEERRIAERFRTSAASANGVVETKRDEATELSRCGGTRL